MTDEEKLVICHICPMQELCEFAEPLESLKRAEYLEKVDAKIEFDSEKLAKAKENCPIRKKLRE